MPGGVNSPVRAFTNMDRELLFIEKALKKPKGLIFMMLMEKSI